MKWGLHVLHLSDVNYVRVILFDENILSPNSFARPRIPGDS